MSGLLTEDEREALVQRFATTTPGPRYVTRAGPGEAPPAARIWTISPEAQAVGWENDSDCDGYGLAQAEAEVLVFCHNLVRRLVEEAVRLNNAAGEA